MVAVLGPRDGVDQRLQLALGAAEQRIIGGLRRRLRAPERVGQPKPHPAGVPRRQVELLGLGVEFVGLLI